MISLSFLSAGPKLSLSLPPQFSSQATLESPIAFETDFARSCVYYPESLDSIVWPSIEPTVTHLEQRDAPEGITVDVYDQPDPGQWHLRWHLPHGALYSHVRYEDRMDRVDLLIDRLVIDVTDDHPVLLPEAPLFMASRRQLGHEDLMMFFVLKGRRRAHVGTTVTLRRPAWIREGRERVSPGVGGSVVVLAGLERDIDVEVAGAATETEAREFVEVARGAVRAS